jgi:hypothetical protein
MINVFAAKDRMPKKWRLRGRISALNFSTQVNSKNENGSLV